MTAGANRARTWLPWLVMGVVLAIALAVGAARTRGPETAQDRVTALGKQIKCPTCRGESVADSNASTSKEIRKDIAQRVEAGQTDDQIRAYYVDKYGDGILLTPSSSGVAGLVWAIPVVVGIGAIAALVVVFRRWRNEPAPELTEQDRELVADALGRYERSDGADDT